MSGGFKITQPRTNYVALVSNASDAGGIGGTPVCLTTPTTGDVLTFDGAEWCPAVPVSTTVQCVYDANAAPYSCLPNSAGHDNRDGITSAIADAVTCAAANDGIGVVEFDAGEYYINGALQTAVGNAYAQIPIPAVTGTASKVLLILRPKIANAQTYVGGLQTTAQAGVVIFRSTLTGQVYSGTFGLPSILGGPQYVRTATFSNLQLHLQGIGFRAPANPTLCGVDAGRLNQAIFENCRWDTTETPGGGYTQPTAVTGLANVVPLNNNNGMADYRGTNSCQGWYAGPSFGEHTQAEKILVFQCYVGTNAIGDNFHAAQIEHLSTEWCPYGIATVDPAFGIVNPTGASGYLTFNINLWDIEDAASGWGVTTYHVNDPGNDYYGRIRYIRILAGTGTQTGALTVNGAANLARDDLTTLPAGSAGFATPAIVLGTAAAAGAATTVIRSDSTIAAFDATVPATQALGDAAATGSVAKAARRDHLHGMPALSTATPLVEAGTGAVGTGLKSSREDHVHPLAAVVASDTPVHVHVANLTYSGDGATTDFELPASPVDAYSVMAYVAGVRTDITVSGPILTNMNFAVAPVSGTNNIIVDVVAAVI